MGSRWPGFLAWTFVLWLVAHAAALLCHEFSHSFLAWVLHWKSNPLALNWGHSSLMNLLLQVDIDENVNYTPIFAHGHPYQAAIISLAGMALGNAVISMAASLLLFTFAQKRGRSILGIFAYWLAVMSFGNLISYVPLRVFTSHADMYTVATGFGWSQKELLLLLGLPILAAELWFLLCFEPHATAALAPHSSAQRTALVVLTSLTLFGWFSLAGISGYGAMSHTLSLLFLTLLGPASIVLGLLLTRRSVACEKEIAN